MWKFLKTTAAYRLRVYGRERRVFCVFLHKVSVTSEFKASVYTCPHTSPLSQYYNTYFSLRAKCWVRGGVGGQFPRNLN